MEPEQKRPHLVDYDTTSDEESGEEESGSVTMTTPEAIPVSIQIPAVNTLYGEKDLPWDSQVTYDSLTHWGTTPEDRQSMEEFEKWLE